MMKNNNKTYALLNNMQSVSVAELFIDDIIQGNIVTEDVLSKLNANDTLVVEGIQSLGNTIDEIVMVLNNIFQNSINLYLADENLSLNVDKLQEFSLSLRIAYQLHRKHISLTTKRALEAVKAKGKRLGHPVGKKLTKKLDDYQEEIKHMLASGVTKATIAKKYNVCWRTVSNYIRHNPELLLRE